MNWLREELLMDTEGHIINNMLDNLNFLFLKLKYYILQSLQMEFHVWIITQGAFINNKKGWVLFIIKTLNIQTCLSKCPQTLEPFEVIDFKFIYLKSIESILVLIM